MAHYECEDLQVLFGYFDPQFVEEEQEEAAASNDSENTEQK